MNGPTQSADFSVISTFRYRWHPRSRRLVLRAYNHSGFPEEIPERVFWGLLWLAGVADFAVRVAGEQGVTTQRVWVTTIFALVGVIMLTDVDDVMLDFSKGRYCFRRGLWPFLLCRCGNLYEIKVIRVRAETRTASSKAAGTSKYKARVVYVCWKNPAVPPLCLAEGRFRQGNTNSIHKPNAADVEFDAYTLGQLICVAVVQDILKR